MKEPLCKKGTVNISINSEPPKPTTFEDLGYVQVVRCKDCKNRYNSMYCPIALIADLLKDTKVFQYKCSNDWFCADGERSE